MTAVAAPDAPGTDLTSAVVLIAVLGLVRVVAITVALVLSASSGAILRPQIS